jgi:hypothetical protein
MRKHEMSYHEYSNDISFLSKHCNHLKAFERSFSLLSTQIKEILQKARKEKNEFKLIRILKRNEKIEFSLLMCQQSQQMIETSDTKKSSEIVLTSKKNKKKRKRKTKKSIMIESTDSKIYMIEAISFNLLIRQKKAQVFVLFLRKIDAQIYSISQVNIDI